MTVKQRKLDDLIYRIRRQYPERPSTFSPCECGKRSARGADDCGYCLELDLANLLGSGNEDLAITFHKSIRGQNILIGEMMGIVKGE